MYCGIHIAWHPSNLKAGQALEWSVEEWLGIRVFGQSLESFSLCLLLLSAEDLWFWEVTEVRHWNMKGQKKGKSTEGGTESFFKPLPTPGKELKHLPVFPPSPHTWSSLSCIFKFQRLQSDSHLCYRVSCLWMGDGTMVLHQLMLT